MCGITGWVDFESDLTMQTATVARMMATMADRGPDDESMWIAPHAAIAHRRLAVIDIEGGRQPMVAELGSRPPVVLTYSGEVYNFVELRAELQGRGHFFRTRSDTEVVLHAYLEWGEKFPEHLNGMYALAVWDAKTEELILVRDRLGIKPLYYYPLDTGVIFGSEPKAILANPRVRRMVDLDGMRELLAYVKTPEHAIFRGMKEVRPGDLIRVSRNGIDRRSYWRLQSVEHTDDLESTIRAVRDLLADSVTRQLISDVPLCVLLSGGLDSSAITALCRRSGTVDDIQTVAVDFTGYSEQFRPDPMRDMPDRPFAQLMASYAGATHAEIVLDTADLMDADTRNKVLYARDIPSYMGDIDTSMLLLFRGIRQNFTVSISGEAADELFGGYHWFFDPAIINGHEFPWLAGIGRDIDFDSLFHQDLRELLDLRSYRLQSYTDTVAEVPRLSGERRHERRMRELTYMHLTRSLQLLLDRKDRMSMAVGLEVRVPYCDHRLVEYVFNVPWAMKTFDGREKSLLRSSVADLLPESIVGRRKSHYPSTKDPAYENALRNQLVEIATDSNAPVSSLIDPTVIKRIKDLPLPEASWQRDRMSLDMVLHINNWLSHYKVDVSL